MEFNIISLLA